MEGSGRSYRAQGLGFVPVQEALPYRGCMEPELLHKWVLLALQVLRVLLEDSLVLWVL